MQTHEIIAASQVPATLQRAAKVALSVGAELKISSDGEQLLAKFKDSDSYYFDPEHVTLHMLEALGAARTYGFVLGPARVRDPLVVRITYSNEDVRVQIGASKWFRNENTNTAIAMRHALVDAMCAYYDQALAPYAVA